MPKDDATFWNPYRWVTVSDRPVEHDAPRYHHALSGLSGHVECDLEALTPLFIGGGRGVVEFVRHRNNRPYIPATSLKGALRSLAEVVGNAAVPFPRTSVDREHGLDKSWTGTGADLRLDVVARTFGHLHDGHAFAGLIRFSDAEMIGETQPPPNQWPQQKVVVGQPKSSHGAFYPGTDRRKFYHHRPGATQLTPPPAGATQISLRPAPPGARFSFTVHFTNLRDDELDLLLYCLALEEQVAVTLSPAALGRAEGQEPVTLQGPLRHKIGYAKPHGAGSVHIRVTRMALRADATARYRGHDAVETWEGRGLAAEIDRRTASFRNRADLTMQELRALLIYAPDDPRTPVRYPPHHWFRESGQVPLKPTL